MIPAKTYHWLLGEDSSIDLRGYWRENVLAEFLQVLKRVKPDNVNHDNNNNTNTNNPTDLRGYWRENVLAEFLQVSKHINRIL